MAQLKSYRLDGKVLTAIEIDDALLKKEVNSQMVKDYLVLLRRNKRQWSAYTKGKGEVIASNLKPHPQKGTGRARQGSLASPQYRGGGVVHGPKPKFDQAVRMNKKEKRAALIALFSTKVDEEKALFVDYTGLEVPKTQRVMHLLEVLQLEGKRILFINGTEDAQKGVIEKSVRNLPMAQVRALHAVNGYDVALNEYVIIAQSAASELKTLLQRGAA